MTETALIADFHLALNSLRRLKALGVSIAMDDFGTGYSSLANLRAFPFDKIKIDRSFIQNVHKNDQAAAIVRAIVGLGRGMSLTVLAEGVESLEELDFLSNERAPRPRAITSAARARWSTSSSWLAIPIPRLRPIRPRWSAGRAARSRARRSPPGRRLSRAAVETAGSSPDLSRSCTLDAKSAQGDLRPLFDYLAASLADVGQARPCICREYLEIFLS